MFLLSHWEQEMEWKGNELSDIAVHTITMNFQYVYASTLAFISFIPLISTSFHNFTSFKWQRNASLARARSHATTRTGNIGENVQAHTRTSRQKNPPRNSIQEDTKAYNLTNKCTHISLSWLNLCNGCALPFY